MDLLLDVELRKDGSDGDITGFSGYGYWIDGNVSYSVLILVKDLPKVSSHEVTWSKFLS